MANKKITDLVDIGTPASGDLLEIVDISEGVSKRVAVSALGSGSTPTLQEVSDAGGLSNGATLKQGTTDAGLGGVKGIALKCSVDYELKWEAGRLYIMEQDGFTIREVSHNFSVIPDITDDDSKGFVVGSRWILDNGIIYTCSDATTGAAVWDITVSGTPTLQEVLDNNHDLVDGNFFVGTLAGDGNSGTYVIGIGDSALRDNTTDYNVAIGSEAGFENTGTGLSVLGVGAGYQNSGDNVVAIGLGAGIFNTYNYVTLFGTNATADENGQTVLSKDDTIMARISTALMTGTRKYNLPDDDGTLALTTDIPPAITIDATPTDGSANAVSSNGVFDALALKADLDRVEQYVISKPVGSYGSVTGTVAETVILSIPFSGGDFEIGDYLGFNIWTTKVGTAGATSITLRAGTTGTTADSVLSILQQHVNGQSSAASLRQGILFETGNFINGRTRPAVTQASIDFGSFVNYARFSLDPSNPWFLTFTVTHANAADSITVSSYQVNKTKTF